jgi:hypothetical protein
MATLTIQSAGWDTLPATSRVWVYQSARPLANDELDKLVNSLDGFMQKWNTHGTNLTAGYQILHDRFVVLCVNEEDQYASGCSIDSSVKLLKDSGAEFKVDFFDRTTVIYKDMNGAFAAMSMAEFSGALAAGELTEETTVFNNLVATKADLATNHETTVSKSWHAQLMS